MVADEARISRVADPSLDKVIAHARRARRGARRADRGAAVLAGEKVGRVDHAPSLRSRIAPRTIAAATTCAASAER